MTNNNTKSIVYVVVDLWPLPDKIDQVKKILTDLVPEAKKERSCLKYELCANLNNKAQFTLLEAWSSDKAVNEHFSSEPINKATEELRQLLLKPTDIRRYKNIG